MSSLRQADIFRLKPLISNFQCKLSAITEYNPKKQVLCIVSVENEILFRYTRENGSTILKLLSWFNKTSRVIHDVCFDPSGSWLLVLCFDNTLHIVPALKLLDAPEIIVSSTFKLTEITSFVIPFVGPHECPSSKTCPNHDRSTTPSSSPVHIVDYVFDGTVKDSSGESAKGLPIVVSSAIVDFHATESNPYISMEDPREPSSIENSRKSSKNDGASTISHSNETNATSRNSSDSFLTSSTCPYPLSAVWWQTLDKRNRAIIGYSDGSICFVGLSPNCPFIANTSIENGGVLKLFVCRDNSMENVTLLINSTIKQQWKLLLEQKCINYTFPGDISPPGNQQNESREDWQFVMPIKANEQSFVDGPPNNETSGIDESTSSSPQEGQLSAGPSEQRPQESEDVSNNKVGILPAAKASLSFLKTLGTKKFNALKMKLSEQKFKMDEYMSEGTFSSFAIVDSPTTSPEILTTPAGPYFVVQNLRNTYLLSALHNYSDTLSVHSMDISLIPLFLYKIPKNCQEVLIGSNLLYAIQLVPNRERVSKENNKTKNDESNTDENDSPDKNVESEEKMVNAVTVISSAMASMKNGEEIEFNERALLGTFTFPGETVISIYRMASCVVPEKSIPKEESNDTLQSAEVRSPSSYIRHQRKSINEQYSLNDVEFMRNEFPNINYDPCIVITNKNTYFIDLHAAPYEIFLNAALRNDWATCEEFCTTFDLNFQQCIEFAGDYLLRKKKVTQALLTYNMARIPPVRTALKLAIFGENYALMHLCAMAMKCVFILKSKYFSKPVINVLFDGADYRHSEKISHLMPKKPDPTEKENEGKHCSDFNYGVDESVSCLQMSASSQFHLSNLLLITLAERSVKDKNYIPLWNFLVSNTKFHTNMTSIVLCQSGLYSSALLLALTRGACIDVFVGLVSVASQEFGWYSELNVLLYNLSDTVFVECITYLRHISTDFFNILQEKLSKIEMNVLERLEKQLNPFSSAFRPIVFNLPLKYFDAVAEDNYSELNAFCKVFIETYLGIILQLETLREKPLSLLNALTTFKLNHEDNQFAIESSKFPPISAGCSHCACVIDGYAYFWGSNGIPVVYSVTKAADPPEPPHAVKSLDIISQLNLEVHAVKCGRLHSLVLTNNGLYSFGSNQLGQLGIKSRMLCALQPMLVEAFENKRITILEAGQYHNATVTDDRLYTWGWGVYGQLGHGDTENSPQPKEVSFFRGMKIQQVSLGHTHSLVLCSIPNGLTNLYVFGSNHFGQLGVGPKFPSRLKQSNLVKSTVPLKLEFSESPIRLIHTKFFSNLAVTDKNELYTWGSSPQALRLANQIKRRATAKQKIEENLRKEINKRIESNNDQEADSAKEDMASKSNNSEEVTSCTIEACTPKIETQETPSETAICSTVLPCLKENANEEIKESTEGIETKKEEGIVPTITIEPSSIEDAVSTENEVPEMVFPQGGSSKKIPDRKPPETIEPESIDHMFPQLVDTSEVSGQVLQLSTGLFHYALISSTSLLYTWGKNLEHQLGTEDKDRKAVSKPTPLESIENPLHVECGADFTIVITTDYVVKAFGGNTNGQCGKDLGPPVDKNKGKLFCLPTTKRLMRLEGQCVEVPLDISLPRPRIQMDPEPIRYLKSVPKFKPQLVQRSGLSLNADTVRSLSSGGNVQDYNAESDEVASSVENVSLNEEDSPCTSGVRAKNLSSDVSPEEDSKDFQSELSIDDFRHYVHYCLYIFHGLYDTDKISEFAKESSEFRIRVLMLNFKFVEAFKVCLTECQTAQKSIKIFEFFTKDTSIVPMRRQDLKYFIYELFIHFLSQKFDLVECEKFFLTDLDYYLLELSYVLFFNNNNTEMEQQLNKTFKNLFLPDTNEDHKLEDTDKIFDNLSIKFKSIVCQRLLQVSED